MLQLNVRGPREPITTLGNVATILAACTASNSTPCDARFSLPTKAKKTEINRRKIESPHPSRQQRTTGGVRIDTRAIRIPSAAIHPGSHRALSAARQRRTCPSRRTQSDPDDEAAPGQA